MPVVDTLITRYTLDDSGYKQGAASVQQTTGKMSSGMMALGSSALPMLGMAIAAVTAGLGAFAAKSSQLAMDFEAQTKALSLYETAGWKTADMLKQLKEVAKLPGLGNMEAIQSSVRLMASGFDFTASTRAIMALGNALAAAGGSKEDLNGVILQFGQMASKGKLAAEEISVIAERVPQIRSALLDAFGTANTEAIQKMGIKSSDAIMMLVASLEKLPTAASTAKNEISNLGDVAEMAMINLATATNNQAMPAIKELGSFIEFLSESKIMTQIGADIAGLFGMGSSDGGTSPMIRMMAYAIAWGQQMIMAVSNIKDAIVNTINTVRTTMAGFMDALPLGIGKGWAASLRAAWTPGAGLAMLGGIPDLGGAVTQNAETWISQFEGRKANPSPKLTGGTVKDTSSPVEPPKTPAESELEKQTQLLSSIDKNTSPNRNQILGGGSIGAMGVTPQELGAMGRGRGKLDMAVRLIAEWAGEAQAKSGADFLKMANPFIGGR